jgi:hypothetical protein
MLLHKGNRFHGMHGEGVDLDLRHEVRAVAKQRVVGGLSISKVVLAGISA